MARPDVQELYSELKTNVFRFMPRGSRTIHEVYAAVRRKYPHLCDDSFLCATNCSSGHNQPEWQHTVRRVLQSLKSSTGPVRKDSSRGMWRFT